MKTKIYNYLNKPYVVVLIMLIAPIFGFIDRNFVFFFGLGIAFLILWGSNFDWSKFFINKMGSINGDIKTTINDALFNIMKNSNPNECSMSLDDYKNCLIFFNKTMREHQDINE